MRKALNRPVWFQSDGMWTPGLNDGALIEFDDATKQTIREFLNGQNHQLTLTIPDE